MHYLGVPVDMPKVLKLAKKYNLKVMEDCALAIGSKIKTNMLVYLAMQEHFHFIQQNI